MIAQSAAEIISRVRLTVEGIDRMYLNVFVPDLQYEQGIVHFFRTHRGCGGRAVRELRLGKPCCDHQRKDSRKGRRGSRFQLKYRKQPHAK